MRTTKALLLILVAVTALVSIASLQPLHTTYMLQHHLDGTTTVFELVGPYWPDLTTEGDYK